MLKLYETHRVNYKNAKYALEDFEMQNAEVFNYITSRFGTFSEEELQNLNTEEKQCYDLLVIEEQEYCLMDKYKELSIDKEKIHRIVYEPNSTEKEHLIDSLNKLEYKYFCELRYNSAKQAMNDIEDEDIDN